jgi:hypothetical protein
MQKRCSCVLGQPSRGQQSFSLEERKPTKQLGDSSWVTTNRWQPNSRVSKTLSGGRPGRGCSQQVAVFLAAAAGCQDLAMGQRPAFASDARLAIGQSSSCHSNWNLSASAFSLLPLNGSTSQRICCTSDRLCAVPWPGVACTFAGRFGQSTVMIGPVTQVNDFCLLFARSVIGGAIYRRGNGRGFTATNWP